MPATVSDFTQVQGGKVYGTADVAALFGVTVDTVLIWIKTGKLATTPRVSPVAPHRILGSTLLKMLGDQQAELPTPVETPAERRARADAAVESIRRTAKARQS